MRWKNNKEELSKKRAVYYRANKRLFQQRDIKYRENNREKINSRSALRHAIKKQATPKWLTEEHKKQITQIYKECLNLTKQTGIPHHVDHIVPIMGKNVKGLHVPWNLQILTAEENIKKSNKLLVNGEDNDSKTTVIL